jgi:glutaredoxin 3
MADIEIYSDAWCPYCTRAKNLLTKKGIAFREIEAPSGSPARKVAFERTGRTSVPQIFIDGVAIGGSDDLIALDRAGKLDALVAG